MSDEEKEAIEILKLYFGDNPTLNITKYVNIVLNLIEKQSKEIEELQQEKEYLNCIIESDKDNYINKDKIKSKINYLLKQYDSENFINFEMFIKILQSLL